MSVPALAERLRMELADGLQNDVARPGVMRDPRIEGDIPLAPAAVLLAITDRPEPGLILTQRASTLRQHAGQVAFPGGRVDEDDADEIAAALREADEEIGLPRDQVHVIGTFDRYHSFTGFDIIPVIGVVPPDLPLLARIDEVEDWFEPPLSFLLDPRNHVRRSIHYEGKERPYYEIMWNERRIWGITAAILVKLSLRLRHDRLAA